MSSTLVRPRHAPSSRGARAACLALAGLVVACASASHVLAATLIVDRTDDDAAHSSCDPGVPVDCSLRGALAYANLSIGEDVIEIPSGAVLELDVALGSLDVDDPLILRGLPGTLPRIRGVGWSGTGEPLIVATSPLRIENLRLSGGENSCVYSNSSLELDNAHISSCRSAFEGGCVYAVGLVMRDSRVSQCTTGLPNGYSARGGCVYVASHATVRDSAIDACTAKDAMHIQGGAFYAGNGLDAFDTTFGPADIVDAESTGRGGAVFVSPSVGTPATFTRTQFIGGTALAGGALYVDGPRDVTLVDVTMIGNEATAGGAIYADGATLDLARVTIRDNRAPGAAGMGGGIFLHDASATVENSTISENTARNGSALQLSNGNVSLSYSTLVQHPGQSTTSLTSGFGTFGAKASLFVGQCNLLLDSSSGANFESPGDTCALSPSIDHPAVADLQLSAAEFLVSASGVYHSVHRPLTGSVLLDAVDVNAGACPTVDQLGAVRPVDGDGDLIARCEPGAVESGPGPPQVVFADGFESGSVSGWN